MCIILMQCMQHGTHVSSYVHKLLAIDFTIRLFSAKSCSYHVLTSEMTTLGPILVNRLLAEICVHATSNQCFV